MKDHWPSGWQPTLQVSGYWQGRDEDNLQQTSQMSRLGHQAQTLTSPKGCSSLTCRPVEWPPCPDRLEGAGWHPRGGVRQGQRGLCAVWQLTSLSTPSSFTKTRHSPQHSPFAADPVPFPCHECPVCQASPLTCQPCCCFTAGTRTENWNKDNNYFKNSVSIFFLDVCNTS